jgi:hypothetical protein
MKKIIGILGVAIIAVAMFFSANGVNTSSADTSLASLMTINAANAECRPHMPDADCPIWNVKIIVGWPENQLECTTGGTYVCKLIL